MRWSLLGLALIGLNLACRPNATTVSQRGDQLQTVTLGQLTTPECAGIPTAVRSTPWDEHEHEFGPPPPGYIRIVGGAVPDWRPEDMHAPSPRTPGWYALGPRPITDEYWSGTDDASGRVVSIAPHPTNANVVYIASASGGIWKTTDGGTTWTPLTDELSCLNHGAVALDPSNANTVYAGTGEYTTQSTGDGLFRSTDAGVNWTRIATTAQVGSRCSKVAVDPTNPLRIHVTGGSGYVRSTDGGATWSTRLSGAASDFAINATNPSILYVAKHSDGIYRSTNGGDTLTKLTSGLPTSGVNRIILAIAKTDPTVLYAAFINSSSGLLGLYRTANGGDTWTKKTNTPDFPSPQGWYDACLTVDPTNTNIVYAGGVFPSYAVAGVIKTTNGGDAWTDITVGTSGGQLHPDQHAIAIGPTGIVWVGNDGGVWKSTNGGQSWIDTNSTLTVTQNYQLALHPSDPAQVMGGTQDNGTVGRELDVLAWPQVLSGDGGFSAYDHAQPLRRYVTYVYLDIYRIYNGDWAEINGAWSSDSRNFIAPLVMDPNNSHTLLGGTNRVWRTTNADTSATWTAISTTTVSAGSTLNVVEVAPSDSNTVYTGSQNGKVYVTTDLSNWNARSTGLPSGEISDIAISPSDAGSAYVAFFNTSGNRILYTQNYGVTWGDVTGTLPSGVSVTALAVDWRFSPRHVYAGCGAGVYTSYDDGATWTKDGTDLPNVNIGDLRIDFARSALTAGTYGRGTWRLRLPDVLGDMNCDGAVNNQDIDGFVLALFNPAGYAAAYPNCNIANGDFTGDGAVNNQDIDGFIAALFGG